MKVIDTGDSPRSPFYSQAVKAGGLIFVSGQAPSSIAKVLKKLR